MHASSMQHMARLLSLHLGSSFEKNVLCLDIGSCDVNGSYRQLIPPSWTYVGCDIATGKNVDVVMESEDKLPFADESCDVVLCGQVFEHCKRPWKLMPEIFRVLRWGGTTLIITVAKWPLHRYPVDCWRFYPDGMAVLFEDAGFKVAQVFVDPPEAITQMYSAFHVADCIGIAQKCKS